LPARSVSQRKASVRSLPSLASEIRACLTPAATRAAVPCVVSACTVRSPLLRARLALSRRVSPSTASHSPSSTRFPVRPAPASCGPASSSIHAIGKPVSLPAVITSPGRQRTGCQVSVADAGVVLAAVDITAVFEAVRAGALRRASPAPLSKAPPAGVGDHLNGTAPFVASRHAPAPKLGSSTARFNCLSRPCHPASLSVALRALAILPASAVSCRA